MANEEGSGALTYPTADTQASSLTVFVCNDRLKASKVLSQNF